MVYLSLITILYIYLYIEKYVYITPYIVTNIIFLINLIGMLMYSSKKKLQLTYYILFNIYINLYIAHIYLTNACLILTYLLVSDIIFEKIIIKFIFIKIVYYKSEYYLDMYKPIINSVDDIMLEPNKYILIYTGIKMDLINNSIKDPCYFLKIYHQDMFLASNNFSNDEIKLYLFNNTNKNIHIQKNEPLAEIIVFSPFRKCIFVKKCNY